MNDDFVADPLVPLELRLAGAERVTLYQPGWHLVDGASAFPGRPGTVHVLASLDDLMLYVDRSGDIGLGDIDELETVRTWTVSDYAERLCVYDLVAPPELAGAPGDAVPEDQQLSLGSTLAVVLDLLDQLEVDDPRADRLRDDPHIGRLAAGDPLGSAEERRAVAELLAAHLPWCVEEISRRVEVPAIPDPAAGTSDANADAGIHLEEVADAVTVWFGLTDSGVYTVRTTTVAGSAPRYPETRGAGGARQLTVWASVEGLAADLPKVGAELGDPSFAALDGVAVDPTPDDDAIFDLVQIGETIGPRMSVEQADRLVTAWTEIVRLALWGGWDDVRTLTDPGSAVGSFVVAAAIDRAQDRPGARLAVSTADAARAAQDWTALVRALEGHLAERRTGS